ncbi:MAG TPA: alpha/beta hydrolase [Gemmataceae bacterium]|nr:alpha/beta hydrolase [Gemmataceae bacterium]
MRRSGQSLLAWILTGAILFAGPPAVAQDKAPPKLPKVPDGTKVERDIAYGTHERQKLDVYVPRGDGPFPLVIWVHGGAWQGGSKDGGGPVIPLLSHGYAVASTNYRLSRHEVFPAQIHDVKAAVRFLRANAKKYHLDPERFGACGASAGGHLVALLATSGGVKELEGDGANKDDSSKVSAVIDFFGPTDLARLSPPAAKDNPVTRLLGGTTGDKKDLAALASPVTHVTKDDPPILIVHGDEDHLVPASQSVLLHEALKKAGVDSTLIVIHGAGHGSGIFVPERMNDYVGFFDKHLKKK